MKISILIIFFCFCFSNEKKLDNHTFSNFQEIMQSNINLTLTIDFDQKILKGFTNITFIVQTSGIRFLILDTKNLKITNITNNKSVELSHQLKKSEMNGPLGNPLLINLGQEYEINTNFSILIEYETLPNSSVLHWIDKEYTVGNNFPFVYSNCKTINCRSLLPCQDTPAAKVDLYAKIRVKTPMKVLFSGISYNTLRDGDDHIYYFKSNNRIPTYLFSLAAGDLAISQVGKRSAVWSEKLINGLVSPSFSPAEEYLQKIERYLNKYAWEFMYIVLMPKGYAWISYENPNILFISRSILSFNQPSINDLTNYFSHSWTGSLVTNLNWQNLWLVEGLSTFIERKIIQVSDGEDLFNLTAYRGMNQLYNYINEIGESNKLSSLNPNLDLEDPNLALNIVPKEKGFLFLFYLESLIGKDNFNLIIKNYVFTFKNLSVDFNDFKNIFEVSVSKIFPIYLASNILKNVDWDTWINHSGYPPSKIIFNSKLVDLAKELVYSYINKRLSIKTNFDTWNYNTKLLFLDILHERINEIDDEIYKCLRDQLRLFENQNSQVLHSWFLFALKLKKSDIIPFLEDFLSENGAINFIVDLYKEYFIMDKISAINCFNANSGLYHPIIVEELTKELNKK